MKHQVLIADKDVSSLVKDWSVTENVNMEPRSMNVTLADNPGINVADVVKLYVEYQGSWIKLFEGVVTEFDESLQSDILVSCLDYIHKLQWRMVTKQVYSLRTSDYIIKDLLQTYYLNEFDVSKVSGFTVYGDLNLDYEPVFDAIRTLAQFETADFYVEPEAKRIVVKPTGEAEKLTFHFIEGVNIFNLSKRVTDERLVNDFILRTGAIKSPVDGDAWTEGSNILDRWDKDSDVTLAFTGDGSKVGNQSIKIEIPYLSTSGGWFPKGKNMAKNITIGFNRMRLWWRPTRVGGKADVFWCTDDNNYWWHGTNLDINNSGKWYDQVYSIGSGVPSVLQGLSPSSSGIVGSPSWDNLNYIKWRRGGDSAGGALTHDVDGLYLYYSSTTGIGSPSTMEKTSSNTASQNKYGRRTLLKSAPFIQDPDFAQKYADTYVSIYREPAVILQASTIFNPNIKAGLKAKVQSKLLEIEGEYRILTVTHKADEVSDLSLTNIIPLSLQELLAESQRNIFELMRRTQ